MKPLRFAEHRPAAGLADVVACYWTFEARATTEPFVHHVWPDGCVSLVIGRAPGGPPFAGIAGPTRSARRTPILPGAVYRGVRFWPDAGAAAVGVAVESLRQGILPAVVAFGPAIDALVDAVMAAADTAALVATFDDWLPSHLPTMAAPDAAVRRAVVSFIASHGERPVATVAADVGLGARQLQRRFRRAVGLTPKEYARIRRTRSTLAALLRGEGSVARLAVELGYADQSHLTREIGDLTGFTPSALRERLAIIEHDDVVP